MWGFVFAFFHRAQMTHSSYCLYQELFPFQIKAYGSLQYVHRFNTGCMFGFFPFSFFAIMNKAYLIMYKSFYGYVFLFLLGKFLEVKLLGTVKCLIRVRVTLCATAKLISKEALYHLYPIRISVVPYAHQQYFQVFLILAILMVSYCTSHLHFLNK